MGAQKINSNPNANAGQYQFNPQIKVIDPNTLPAGGISLQPFSSEQEKKLKGFKGATAAAIQNVSGLQKPVLNNSLIQQQQQAIDAERQKNPQPIQGPANLNQPSPKYNASPAPVKNQPLANYTQNTSQNLNLTTQEPKTKYPQPTVPKSPARPGLFTAIKTTLKSKNDPATKM